MAAGQPGRCRAAAQGVPLRPDLRHRQRLTRRVSRWGAELVCLKRGCELTYAGRARPALAVPYELRKTRPGGFDGAIEVATTTRYLEMFDENGANPDGLLWVVIRAMGKRELSEMTAFELVILVVLGDIIQQGVTQEDMSVTGAALAISTMAMLAVGSVIGRRFAGTRPSLAPFAWVIVETNGKFSFIERSKVDDQDDADSEGEDHT